MPNLQPWKTRSYLADSALPITTKQIDDAKITLAAYDISASRLRRIAPAKRLTGLAPSIKLRPIALGEYHNLVCGDWSDPVTLAAPLSAGKGLRITLASDEPILVKKIVGFQIGFAMAAGEFFKIASAVPVPGKFLRFGRVPDEDLVFEIDLIEEGWPELSEVVEVAAANLYGSIPDIFNFGLGEGGITLPHAVKTFDSETDSVSSTFKTGATFSAKFSVNPSDEQQLRNVLSRLGYNYFNDSEANFGSPLESTPNIIALDMDLPYIAGVNQNRLFAFGVVEKTLTEATLSAALSSKNAFEIDLKWYKSPYFHQSLQTYAGNR